MVSRYLNLKAYHQSDLYHPHGEKEMGLDDLSEILPPSLAKLELSKDKYIDIPEEISDTYSTFRPTPLTRVRELERAIDTSCEIYVKNEGLTPTGNHKANSAYPIAFLCKRDGVAAIATETTGNWGIALAVAGRRFGVEVVCFLDHESHAQRPDRKSAMEELGAEVVVVQPQENQKTRDLLTLSADAAIEFTKQSRGVYYVFGSVYGYFVIPQSVIGLEIKNQLEKLNRYPDVVVGTCGGGASLLGTAAVFLADIVDENGGAKIVSAEAESCPVISEGRMGIYSIDTQQYYPMLKTYGIDELKNGGYVGGLGSTVVASSVAFFHSQGMIDVNRFSADDARNAAETLYKSEGILVALESGYTVAAVIKQARDNDNKVIVANVSSGDRDRQFYTCDI
ncbi:MAG: pyridoxal-phosphate dependent enzyme [Dehalococcoidia bacterium]